MLRFVESTKRRGFTLMELLVVLAILVLLMAMVAPRVLKFLGKSDISVTQSQIGSLKKSLDLYYADCGKYPSTEQGLNALMAPPTMGQSGTAQRGWDGPYLDGDAVPLDAWQIPFGYAFPRQRSRGPGPEIWSFGPDNMDGTEDDIVSWTVAVSSTGEGMPGEEGMMGGELGPDGMPMMDQGGLPPMDQGGLPPMDQGGMPGMDQGGLPPMNQGGLPPAGGTGQMGGGLPPMNQGGLPPMNQGGLPPAGGTGQMGGGLGPAPAGGVPPSQPQPQPNF